MFDFNNISFVNPEFLLFLLVIPFLAFRYMVRRNKHHATLRMSTLAAFRQTGSWRAKMYPFLHILRLLALVAFIVALARPRAILKEEQIKAEGIDIFLVSDLSSSMLARDFEPDRLEASKAVGKEFIDKRPYDRIGLAVFAGEAVAQCPLTTDHRVLKEILERQQCGELEDGTAIGLGLATAVNRLRSSEAKSKVVILLTDGVNNAGEYMMPMTAAEIAKQLGVKVYTIGIGTTGDAYAPIGRRGDGEYVFGFVRVEIDEALLIDIAKQTSGRYFRAVDRATLEAIYDEIDRLEKTEIDVTTLKRYREEFHPWLRLGLLLLGIELLFQLLVFRTIP
ncbi:MAG: VWA domain-containing protein [Bacteroidota bacterium]